MTKKSFLSVFLLILSVSINLSAQTAEEITGKYIDATGGETAWNNINTIIETGSSSMMGMDFPFKISVKRPGYSRLEINIQGKKMIQAFDGDKAWIINPMSGSEFPETADEQTEKSLKRRSNIGNELLNYKNNGLKIEYNGIDSAEGKHAYVIKGTDKDGEENLYYIDVNTNLLVLTKGKMKAMGKTIDVETAYGVYKEVGGVQFPYWMEVRSERMPGGSQKVIVDKIEINQEIDDSIFKMPE